MQRAMARCRRGSCRYRQLRRRKARLEARVARQRREHLHEWSTDIIRRAAALVVVAPKDLKAATASGRGTLRNPGAEVAFKARFNRRVLSFAPGAAIAMLRYKAAEAGCAFDPREDEAAPADLGNKIVRNVKAVRTAKRLINHKQGKARNGSKPAAS
ncbi:MAG TPA: hypothetical protein VF188_06570 [Longimicrobiales bacterium]